MWACPRRQKGRLITSQRPLVIAFWSEARSVRFREQVEALCCTKVCKTPPRVNRGLTSSWEVVTPEGKGWMAKTSVPKKGDSQEKRCIIHQPTG
jgi:hypothetical protein